MYSSTLESLARKPRKTQLKHLDINHNVSTSSGVSKYTKVEENNFLSRKKETMTIRSKYPRKIPLILEKYHRETQLPTLNKRKFLVQEEITISQFLVIIRKRIQLSPTQALFLLTHNRCLLTMSLTMSQAYQMYANEDGFLYITYASQDALGYQDDLKGHELEAVRRRFPNKIPLYLMRHAMERDVPSLTRNKFLVPQEITMSQFLFTLRMKIKLRDSQALFLLVNNKILASHTLTMGLAYEQFRNEDGYLHITYASQEVFG